MKQDALAARIVSKLPQGFINMVIKYKMKKLSKGKKLKENK